MIIINIQVDKIKYNLENDYRTWETVNYNSNIDKINITCQKVILKKDEELRCEIQNSIFSG